MIYRISFLTILFTLAFTLAISLSVTNTANAVIDTKDMGVAKYGALEVTFDYAPLRVSPNVDAKRFAHLRKGITVYADQKYKDFYRVDLGGNKYYWIETKYVESQAVINEKFIPAIEKITFKENKHSYSAKIPMKDFQNAYDTKESSQGVAFTFYDAGYSPFKTRLEGRTRETSVIDNGNNSFTIKYALNKPLVGYGVEREDNALILNVAKVPKINKNQPLKNITVAVDAGHGGKDFGACVKRKDGITIAEKTVNLQIAKRVKKELEKNGAKVVMTRTKDKDTDLYERVETAKEENAMILLSIHQNSLSKGQDVNKKHGVGMYYYNDFALPLAKSLQDELLKVTGFRDDKVNFASFALNRPTEMVSVLVECGYLIYPPELEKLTNKKFQKELAKGIRIGVENYLLTLKTNGNGK